MHNLSVACERQQTSITLPPPKFAVGQRVWLFYLEFKEGGGTLEESSGIVQGISWIFGDHPYYLAGYLYLIEFDHPYRYEDSVSEQFLTRLEVAPC